MSDEHDPTGMSHLLAGLKEPGPMPDELSERIHASLVQEQAARMAAQSDTDADTDAGADSADDTSSADTPSADTVAETGLWSDFDSSDRRPPRPGGGRWILAAAAAAVLVTGVGGLFAIRGNDDAPSSAESAQSPAATSAEKSAESPDADSTEGSDDDGTVPAFVIAASGTDYSRSGLGQEAARLLADPESVPKNADDSILGTMSTAAGAGDCLARLGHPEVQPVVLDVARFGDTPGVLIIAETLPSGSAQAWAVTTGCEPIWPGPTEVPQD